MEALDTPILIITNHYCRTHTVEALMYQEILCTNAAEPLCTNAAEPLIPYTPYTEPLTPILWNCPLIHENPLHQYMRTP